MRVGESEEAIKAALVKYGPLWVGVPICASFYSYASGIYVPSEGDWMTVCGATSHAVALVGYGPDYWLLANSWGVHWGDGGYAAPSLPCALFGKQGN